MGRADIGERWEVHNGHACLRVNRCCNFAQRLGGDPPPGQPWAEMPNETSSMPDININESMIDEDDRKMASLYLDETDGFG